MHSITKLSDDPANVPAHTGPAVIGINADPSVAANCSGLVPWEAKAHNPSPEKALTAVVRGSTTGGVLASRRAAIVVARLPPVALTV